MPRRRRGARAARPRSAASRRGAPFAWLMPYGPIDPREAPGRRRQPDRAALPRPPDRLRPPRRALSCAPSGGRRGGRTFTVLLKDPRTGARTADLIWVPEHDRAARAERPRDPHLAAPRLGRAPRGARARPRPAPRRPAPPPRRRSRRRRQPASPLHGGRRGAASSPTCGGSPATGRRADDHRLAAHAAGPARGPARPRRRRAASSGTGAATTPISRMLALGRRRRGDGRFRQHGRRGGGDRRARSWSSSRPEGHPKLAAFLAGLERHGAVQPFAGRLEGWPYQPLDSTPTIAAAVAAGLARHRRALGLPDAPERRSRRHPWPTATPSSSSSARDRPATRPRSTPPAPCSSRC